MVILIASIALSIATFFIILLSIKEYEKKSRRYIGKKAYGYACIGLLWLLLILFASFVRVEANSVGIVYHELKGGVQDETYTEGLHFKTVFEKITQIETANRSALLTTTGQTNDGQYATFQLSIIYSIKSQDAGKFYRATNSTDINKDSLSTIVKSCLQSSTIKYDIFELLSTGLETARLDFMDDLKTVLYHTYHITVVNVSFDDIDGGQEVEQILQQKAEAEQKIRIAELDADAAMITALNEANIERTLADASSYAIKVKGEANGEAASAYIEKVEGMINDLYTDMNGTITYKDATELILSVIFYNTWDGKLPDVLTSDDLSSMIGSLITNGNNGGNN